MKLKELLSPKRRLPYRLVQYRAPDGSFDYDRYRRVQIEGNKKKIDRIYAHEPTIRAFAEYLRAKIGQPLFGICHGTRRGVEQQWFSDALGCKVIGTEISDTATDFPNTVEWDFHEENPEWIGRADFVYSNSFDHAYDPKKALDVWMRSLRPGGICILEHGEFSVAYHTNELDPFGADLALMPYLILTWGEGRYAVQEIISTPHPKRFGIIIRAAPQSSDTKPPS